MSISHTPHTPLTIPNPIKPNKRAHTFWSRLFPLYKINGNNLAATSIYRWEIFKRPNFCIYLHNIIDQDWTVDPHNHPKAFYIIGLLGGYNEVVYTDDGKDIQQIVTYTAPWIRKFPPSHVHRLIPTRSTWTLAITTAVKQEWGFYTSLPLGIRLIPWEVYVATIGRSRIFRKKEEE